MQEKTLAAPGAGTGVLVERHLDFWLLGGFSLVLWAFAFLLDPLRPVSPSINRHFANLPPLFATFALLVNFPHFMASYRLAYADGSSLLRRGFFQRVAVPAALVALFGAAYFFFTKSLSPFYGRMLGPAILGTLVQVMYFSVGWHYSKQVFGCSLAYARFDGYPVDERQRLILKATLFCVWAVSFVGAQVGAHVYDYYGVKYDSLGLPGFVVPAATACQTLALCLLAYFVVWKNWERHKKLPSPTVAVPTIAFCIWWLPLLRQADYYYYAVPLFHSLQYLAFVHKVESVEAKASGNEAGSLIAKLAWLSFWLVIAGYLAFEGIPEALDAHARRDVFLKIPFFTVAFNLFINIHHYFIDSWTWRKGTNAHRLMSQV